MTSVKLFCFPYAGGSAIVYKRWQPYLHPGIELVPVELAGRGKRIREAGYQDLAAAVVDMLHMLTNDLAELPYALFGHSLGGLIAYELAQRIRRSGIPDPVHLFFSGCGAPHVERDDEKKFHLMGDNEFRRELIGLGGTPPALFDDPAALQVFLPVLKNDFKLAEVAPRSSVITPLVGNITVFLGKQDDLTPEQCEGWRLHTTEQCNIRYFPGGHFFLLDETEAIVQQINQTLVREVNRRILLK